MATTRDLVRPLVQPEDPTGRLSPAEFGALFESFTASAFRLETLAEYRVESDAGRLDLFLKGKPLPPPLDASSPQGEWRQLVAGAVRRGERMYRVHVIPHRLTPYLRYEIEWGYLYNAEAGEEIMLLLHDQPVQLFGTWPIDDFWLFDDGTATCACVRMHYDAVGRFLFGQLITDPSELDACRRARDVALGHATPLQQYLAEVRNS
jgi:hypothetical protein